nr:alpha-amylase family glycosyl hydrolase [Corynebacterium aquilae]
MAFLDYAQQLGTNVIQLGPIFQSASHGYDTLDFFAIDDRLGDEADFVEFIAECESRGLKVIVDGVFNHVAAGSQYDTAPLVSDTVFEGHGSLRELDHSRAEVVDLVVEVMSYWCERGVAGWRLDAAYAMPPEFWAQVVPRVRERFPQAWFVGEMIHGDYADYVQRSGLDSVTQYELWKAVWSSIKDRNFFELEWSLRRHNEFCAVFRPMTFVGNHDVNRIATTVGADGAALAHAVLLTVPGVPELYYGDEQGFTGTKFERVGGDDEVRPSFPQSPSQFSPLGEKMHRWVQLLISVRRRHPWLVDARVETLEVTNEQLGYAVIGAEDSQRVEVWLDVAAGSARVVESGQVVAEYPHC